MEFRLPPIRDRQLLEQALTHRSYANENSTAEDNERLEFLGDAVLGFVAGELLYKRYQDFNEAQLTRLRSALVDEKQLATFAREIGAGRQLRLGKGAQKDGGREKPSLLSDAFEALIAAYFLDAGMEAVRNYLEPLLLAAADRLITPNAEVAPASLLDCKNRFQQWSLAQFQENPQYFIVAESGPDRAKVFTAEVRVRGRVYGVGSDRRKQEAQKRAAEDALKRLGIET